jgi:RNA polymerase sigma-70 factor (ECF subfamily)
MTEPAGAPRARTDADGEPDFEEFFEATHRRLFGTLCLVTGDRAEAEEIVQDAYLRVWERWHRVRRSDDPAAYLFRTAFNLFKNRIRRAARAARRVMGGATPVDPFAQIEEREDLMTALRTLTPRQRAAVVLTDLLDYPSQEAGAILGVRASTVRVLAAQARAAMRPSLEEPRG